MSKQTAKERPINCKARDVLAILEGRKTQTRRIIKGLPSYWSLGKRPLHPSWTEGDFAFYDMADPTGTYPTPFTCPFGRPGDLLWVRETCAIWTYSNGVSSPAPVPHPVVYSDPKTWESTKIKAKELRRSGYPKEGVGCWKITPSIVMPRWASRITLRLTDVRVERLQEISDADAMAEGGYEWNYGFCHTKETGTHESPRRSFAAFWQSINGPDSWLANPWVWVLTHERVKEGE